MEVMQASAYHVGSLIASTALVALGGNLMPENSAELEPYLTVR